MHLLVRRILVILLAACATTALSPTASAGTTQTGTYNMPSSIVVQGVFGFGILLCADSTTPGFVDDLVKNGPCFDYDPATAYATGYADDAFWADTSLTLAIDLNGDGCVSDSCRGVPNDEDVREANCGPVLILTPPITNGASPIIQSFLRALDVNPIDLTICGATSGEVNIVTF